MKLLILISFIYCAFSSTYFGEYFQCSIFDQCKEEYQSCLEDHNCAYEMFSSPCIDPCGVDYAKFFEQMRTYEEYHNDSENIAIFPEASCNFTTCETNWINSLNNTLLKALKQCEMQKCLQAYPSYTFIAHEYAELKSQNPIQQQYILLACNTQIAACEQDEICKEISKKIDYCLEAKGFRADPRTNPDQYFHDHVSSLDNAVLQCLNGETSQNAAYVAMASCIKPIWSK